MKLYEDEMTEDHMARTEDQYQHVTEMERHAEGHAQMQAQASAIHALGIVEAYARLLDAARKWP